MGSENVIISTPSTSEPLMKGFDELKQELKELNQERYESKDDSTPTKEKEACDDFSFSETGSFETSECSYVNGINEFIPLPDVVYAHNTGEYTNSVGASAVWISSGQLENSNTSHSMNTDWLNTRVHKIFIVVMIIIAALIVLGKI
jgi:hypothetical protein